MKKLLIALIGIWIMMSPIMALAQDEKGCDTYMTPQQKTLYNSGVYQFDICAVKPPATGSGGGGGDFSELVGGCPAEQIWNFFKGRRDGTGKQILTDQQIAGIMGNLGWESGFDPLKVQGDGDSQDPNRSNGWGLMQWTPGSKTPGLMQRAGITTPVYQLISQVNLVWWHLNNTSPTGASHVIDGFKQQTSIVAATDYFEAHMEGAGIKHLAERRAIAQQSFTTYTTSGPRCGGGGGGGGHKV